MNEVAVLVIRAAHYESNDRLQQQTKDLSRKWIIASLESIIMHTIVYFGPK